MSSPTELKAQLARAEQALLEAEKEIDRQRRAAAEAADAADESIPEGASVRGVPPTISNSVRNLF